METPDGPDEFVIRAHEDWAPNGAARFRELVQAQFYDDTRFFRVIPSFMVQFGLSGTPEKNAEWRAKTIQDDPVKESNKPGYITFAKTGAPNSRTTQVPRHASSRPPCCRQLLSDFASPPPNPSSSQLHPCPPPPAPLGSSSSTTWTTRDSMAWAFRPSERCHATISDFEAHAAPSLPLTQLPRARRLHFSERQPTPAHALPQRTQPRAVLYALRPSPPQF